MYQVTILLFAGVAAAQNGYGSPSSPTISAGRTFTSDITSSGNDFVITEAFGSTSGGSSFTSSGSGFVSGNSPVFTNTGFISGSSPVSTNTGFVSGNSPVFTNTGFSTVGHSSPGGIDFSGCIIENDGSCCITSSSSVQSLEKDPILECNHKEVEKCHYTYVTKFSPTQEEVCEENFEKTCQITFRQVAQTSTVKKCYKPLRKVCDGTGETECKTFYETSCSTQYIEKSPGKFVGDTRCEKLPVELCGQGCRAEEGEEQCHDKQVDTLVEVPEELCDLNPQKACRFTTKLVPSLKPERECTVSPQEICNLKFSTPRQTTKPLTTKWCRDPNGQVVRDVGHGASFSNAGSSLSSFPVSAPSFALSGGRASLATPLTGSYNG